MFRIIIWLLMIASISVGVTTAYNRINTPYNYEKLPFETKSNIQTKTKEGKELEYFIIYSKKMNDIKTKEIDDKFGEGGVSVDQLKIAIRSGSSFIFQYRGKEVVITAKKGFLLKLAEGGTAYQHSIDDEIYYSHITPSDGKITVLIEGNKGKSYTIDELSVQ